MVQNRTVPNSAHEKYKEWSFRSLINSTAYNLRIVFAALSFQTMPTEMLMALFLVSETSCLVCIDVCLSLQTYSFPKILKSSKKDEFGTQAHNFRFSWDSRTILFLKNPNFGQFTLHSRSLYYDTFSETCSTLDLAICEPNQRHLQIRFPPPLNDYKLEETPSIWTNPTLTGQCAYFKP